MESSKTGRSQLTLNCCWWAIESWMPPRKLFCEIPKINFSSAKNPDFSSGRAEIGG